MIDNVTGKATRVDFWPTRFDMVLAAGVRDKKMMAGWLLMQLTEAALRLWPDFIKAETKPPFNPRAEPEPPPPQPFRPRWHRRMTGDEDDDGGI